MTRAWTLWICATAASLLALLGAGTAQAGLITGGSCSGATKPFAQWGDYRSYVFGANGGLELGGTGWALSGGASVVSGNESFFVHSPFDSHSLVLPTGASATTPPMCMGTTSTVIRFFLKSNAPGSLRVQVVERNLLGMVIGVLDWTSFSGTPAWQPSPTVTNLDSLLGLLGASSVQLRFTATSGSYQVDDVYVDPLASSD